MEPGIKQALWDHCASNYLSYYPTGMTKEEMEEILSEGQHHPRIHEIRIWELLKSLGYRGLLETIRLQYNNILKDPLFTLVGREFAGSAETLAHYVNYNGEEDEDYLSHLQEGNAREDHIAYHAHVVGEWDDLVWEKFSANEKEDA